MPHEVRSDGATQTLIDEVAVGAVLRALRTAAGDAVVLTSAPATRDGAPVAGNVTTVARGESAIVRVGRRRVDVVWRAIGERCVPGARRSCRLCYGSFVTGEVASTCSECAAVFHDACQRVRIHCPGCGAWRGEEP